MRLSGVAVGVLAFLAAGALPVAAAQRIVLLTPENHEASALGQLNAYLDEGQGRSGAIWLKLPNGELVKGRFEARKGGTVGALGKQYGLGRPGVAYTASGTLITHGTPVNIDMKGPSGVSVHCEVFDDDGNKGGSGVCLFPKGAVYHVLY
jgi:hypothetical protein